ncbi:hypothetical protein ACS127_07805 [Amphibacillus sp. Q70]|uniref:hypothetical protein n=1 Tax=Amphibacillus sp. Q70 TaxID=3453416 RepID=UPI003F83A932
MQKEFEQKIKVQKSIKSFDKRAKKIKNVIAVILNKPLVLAKDIAGDSYLSSV